MNINDLMAAKEGKIDTNIPHNSLSKRAIVAVKHAEDTIRVYVKGAPEQLLPKCHKTYNTDNRLVLLSEDEQNYI
jgi:magnesium-transporting ATPase (P-type)